MADRPILFSDPMVRAMLDGRKTQTRRVMRVQPKPYAGGCSPRHTPKHPTPYLDSYCSERKTATNPRGMSRNWCWWTEDDRQGPSIEPCPFGHPGDLLWVREAHAFGGSNDPGVLVTRADYPACVPDMYENIPDESAIRWRPSIHMPRRFSRLTLRLTDVRAQRLQDISEEDARAEGCIRLPASGRITDTPGGQRAGRLWWTASAWFRETWESLHGPDAWNENPWVWALSFDVLHANIDAVQVQLNARGEMLGRNTNNLETVR